MRKVMLLLGMLMGLVLSLSAQKQNAAYLAYIEEWRQTALENEADYGIPASIIMAQALLESGAGQSELAVYANNHFGIKCTNDWFGGVYYHDDDSKGECFRQYGNAAESFKDHALFLQRPRYTTCFEIALEDYEGWAHRLKACGYATDPGYANKLIKIIEDYGLEELRSPNNSKTSPTPIEGRETNAGLSSTTKQKSTNVQNSEDVQRTKGNRPLKAEVVHKSEPIMVIHNDPEPEYVAPLSAREERDSFYLMHPKARCNGVNYVLAREGDTYANVAFRLNIRERELREYNDALGRELEAGDRIYLWHKKRSGEKDYVWTHVGQSFWQLVQEEGVSLEAIQKLNEIDPSVRVFRTKQRIYLRKVKDESNGRH